MFPNHALEDSAARAKRESAEARHTIMKSALSRPVAIPGGFLDPIQLIAKARAQMENDRARANVVPFKKMAPAPRPAPPAQPSRPLRPAAILDKLAAAPDRKHLTPDAAQRHELAQLFLRAARS